MSDFSDFPKSSTVKRENILSNDTLHLPLVSIIITNYNYLRFVKHAIDSVACQSYSKFECIVVDDNSSDSSGEFIVKYIASLKDIRFRAIRLGLNLGQMGAIKAGLENSSGSFVIFLDADDLLLERCIEKHTQAHLNGAYSAAISACDTIQIEENGCVLEGTIHLHAKDRQSDPNAQYRQIHANFLPVISNSEYSIPLSHPSLIYIDRQVQGWKTSACSSLMFRKSVLDIIIPVSNDKFRICADYYFAKLAHFVSGTIILSEPLVAWRLHSKNNFSSNPVLGGRYSPGTFTQSGEMDREIGMFVLDNFSKFSALVGPEACKKFILKSYPKNKIFKLMKRSPSFRQYVEKGRPWRFWFKHGFKRVLRKQR